MSLTDHQRISILAMAFSKPWQVPDAVPRHGVRNTPNPDAGLGEDKQRTIAAWTKALEGFGGPENYNRCLLIARDAATRIQKLTEPVSAEQRAAAIQSAIDDSAENWLVTGDVPGVTLEKVRTLMAQASESRETRLRREREILPQGATNAPQQDQLAKTHALIDDTSRHSVKSSRPQGRGARTILAPELTEKHKDLLAAFRRLDGEPPPAQEPVSPQPVKQLRVLTPAEDEALYRQMQKLSGKIR